MANSIFDTLKDFIFRNDPNYTGPATSGGGGIPQVLDWGNVAKIGLPALLMYAQSRTDNSETLGDLFGTNQPTVGYQGGIPRYTATRSQVQQPQGIRRPGSAGRRYFTDTQFTPRPEQQLAAGGLATLPQSRGYYLGGATDGMADEVPAKIDGVEQAALSDGEFVWPADVVSHLGNGNSNAGAKVLYKAMERIRAARTGSPEQGRQIDPGKFVPGAR